jgi:hypothetical protein
VKKIRCLSCGAVEATVKSDTKWGLGIFHQLVICAALIVTSQGFQAFSTQAQNVESQLVQAMQGLGVTWQQLSQTQAVLLIDCQQGGFIGVRLTSGALVRVDLQKTTSLMNPYLGIVNLTGRFENNANPYDHSCLDSKQDALNNDDWHGNDLTFDFQIYYQINGSELWLTAGNPFFQNAFLSQPGPPEVEAGTDWHRAFRYPISAPNQH